MLARMDVLVVTLQHHVFMTNVSIVQNVENIIWWILLCNSYISQTRTEKIDLSTRV